MKKLIILLPILIFSVFQAQNKIVNPAKFEVSQKTNDVVSGLHGDVKVAVKDGKEQNINIYFEYMSSKSEFDKLGYEKIDRMITLSRDALLRNLKNKYSFNPKKVAVSYDESLNAWAIIWEYVANNSYGGEVVGNQVILYNDDLQRIEI
ncbi:hypothetical protein [Chryseobacterium indoltheticum]|uniref:Nuclear transport factor 2 family protein n=1 Tax=Chryseobacterium indoltheticum TaxID=254 RepID=A0A381FIG1_9FLAO|nr:hypothetical protein [Chryseobacterium indoltheticum]AZA74746.1 hypothetical protein EG358_13665 [Chryseobacterium indoltheticum]SIQ36770.1 hypothetical protein SAMN05421682_104238 [Chryseobacterium indoltheticum]SUX45942.1 Uncharacterised protein [Chryseobacterium indoltheticum]